jgi:hypothetical protein
MPNDLLTLEEIAGGKISESPHAAVASPIYFRDLARNDVYLEAPMSYRRARVFPRNAVVAWS